ncbi:hypothetical protein [Pseudorhodoferax sp. Leaf274]|uniref:hypothetical protein n=1 Tax=Pseudorhodoferax sp. Leaf274 TaxID=1736318 RepID=UPI0012E2250C|nr:hypothetical protein [Pseudorhodoferax sp. Leaf274]
MLKVEHDESSPGEPRERCCMCRSPTPFWHRSDVALCQSCARTTKLAQLPTKQEWIKKEQQLFERRAHA